MGYSRSCHAVAIDNLSIRYVANERLAARALTDQTEKDDVVMKGVTVSAKPQGYRTT